MGQFQNQMLAHAKDVLTKVDEHLERHPMGEKYFGIRAANNPNVVKTLRSGVVVQPKTLDKIVEFISAREADLVVETSAASGDGLVSG